MHGIQTSGNCIRNITSDALAGIAPDEVVDPRPYCEILRQWSTLHPEFAFLPRKFKIAVTGAKEDRAAIAWHDIGLQLLQERSRRDRLQGAGRRRHGPHAGDRHAWSASSCRGSRSSSSSRRSCASTTATAGATTCTRRASRSSSRPRDRSSSTPSTPSSATSSSATQDGATHIIPQAEFDRVAAHFVAARRACAAVDEQRHREQRRAAGLSALARAQRARRTASPAIAPSRCRSSAPARRPATPPPNRWTLAADLADRFSCGELRVTHDQNLLLPWVRETRPARAVAGRASGELRRRRTSAC